MKTVKILALAIVLLALAGCAGLPSVTVAFNAPAASSASDEAGEKSAISKMRSSIAEQLRSSSNPFAAIISALNPAASNQEAANVRVIKEKASSFGLSLTESKCATANSANSEFARAIRIERLKVQCNTVTMKGSISAPPGVSKQNLY